VNSQNGMHPGLETHSYSAGNHPPLGLHVLSGAGASATERGGGGGGGLLEGGVPEGVPEQRPGELAAGLLLGASSQRNSEPRYHAAAFAAHPALSSHEAPAGPAAGHTLGPHGHDMLARDISLTLGEGVMVGIRPPLCRSTV